MKSGWSVIIFVIVLTSMAKGQTNDSTRAKQGTTISHDTTKAAKASIVLRKQTPLLFPTMPQLPRMKDNKKSISIDVASRYKRSHPEEMTNWDAINRPPDRYDYPLQGNASPRLVPITPINPQMKITKPLPLRNYIVPTRPEMDVLEILWAKEAVQDTTIYSCLDTVMNITMMDLNNLLERMTNRGLVTRKIVSPRNEFNAFGILIEMSPKNRRNRVYEYHTLVDRNLMRTFIDANIFLFKEDSSIVNRKQLEAARKDSTLLKDLNVKIQRVHK